MFKLAWNRIITQNIEVEKIIFFFRENEDETSYDASNIDNFYLCNFFSTIFIVDIR